MSELKGTFKIKEGFADMFKNGVIMDVTTPDQAKIAEDAGATSVMALERVPADIRKQGGVARMADVGLIKKIMESVNIPVMAKVRIGHIAEANILQSIGVDFVDESEVLTPADDKFHINKWDYKVPFVCGARNLGEALRRIGEGAAMIRTKGEAGTGNIIEAVKHMRAIMGEMRRVTSMDNAEIMTYAKEIQAPYELVIMVKEKGGRLPVVNFAAGGVATPADASLMMLLGADGVFVGSGIFKSKDPAKMAQAIVKAVMHYNDPEELAKISENVGTPMIGLEIENLEIKLQERGW